MAIHTLKRISRTLTPPSNAATILRSKTSSAQYVSARAREPTFEKLMNHYKSLFKVISIQEFILGSSSSLPDPPSISLEFLNRLSHTLNLGRGASLFLRKYPHIFHIFNHPTKLQPFCTLTPTALQIIQLESEAINTSLSLAVDRLVRLLSISITKTLPLRAICNVRKELGLPDDFEDSVIARNPNLFVLGDGNEPNAHVLMLVCELDRSSFVAAVENWRVLECCKEECSVDRTKIRYRFKHIYPPGMRFNENYKAKVEEWQSVSYVGPYDETWLEEKRKTTLGMRRMEKRAVGILHELLSLTVEKMVEVEKISQFSKWFEIDLNIMDLFLDHPGLFYLSTKGKRHTVLLREAYARGCLIDPNPIYEARRKLLDLVVIGSRRLLSRNDCNVKSVCQGEKPTKEVESCDEDDSEMSDE